MGMTAILVMWSNSFVLIFIPIYPYVFIWIFISTDQTVSEKNKF